MSTERTDIIENAIEDPSSVSSDAGSVSNRSIDELIKADKYLTSKSAASAKPKRMGFRVGRFTAPEQY